MVKVENSLECSLIHFKNVVAIFFEAAALGDGTSKLSSVSTASTTVCKRESIKGNLVNKWFVCYYEYHNLPFVGSAAKAISTAQVSASAASCSTRAHAMY